MEETLQRITVLIKKGEELLRQNVWFEFSFGELQWKRSGEKFRILCGDTPLLECKASVRIENVGKLGRLVATGLERAKEQEREILKTLVEAESELDALSEPTPQERANG